MENNRSVAEGRCPPSKESYPAIDFEKTDFAHGGAEKLVEKEQEYLRKGRELPDQHPWSGLAISGGGIRSASFALGLIQALAHKDKLKDFDYLSTVSGGGYIGSAITWMLHCGWTARDYKTNCGDNPREIQFTPQKDCFGYGNPADVEDDDKRIRRSLLRHLRQHGKYLTPGNGINMASLVAVLLRGLTVSLFVYIPVLALLIGGVFYGAEASGLGLRYGLLKVACGLAVLGIVMSLLYAATTWLSRTGKEHWYHARRFFEKVAGFLLIAIVGLVVIGSLPLVREVIVELLGNSLSNSAGPMTAGGVLTAIGGLFAGSSWFSTARKKIKSLPLALQVWIGSAALVYGFLVIAYEYAIQMLHWLALITSPEWVVMEVSAGGILGGWFVAALLVGWFSNTNYLSVHRYYRDRLMETYMPDLDEVLENRDGHADGADKSWLCRMCRYDQGITGPYHIVNTNIVLVESKHRKFRARGGDNFVLSPLYAGSNATGWKFTANFMNGAMTLSTAMAISGAAANPNTGVGGAGPTRNPLLSMLMTLLNIRLGYWVPNPDKCGVNRWPNLLSPGLGELFRYKLNETGKFVQLSDGGHFENLALYELIRRRVKLIICSDGGADPDFSFADFGNMVEKVRVDFGVIVDIDLTPLAPQKKGDAEKAHKVARQGHAVGEIIYPDGNPGVLIYVKTTWLDGLPGDVIAYKNDHPAFPDQSTADQFFDERQFEAYRELGYQEGLALFEEETARTALGG